MRRRTPRDPWTQWNPDLDINRIGPLVRNRLRHPKSARNAIV
jgi:hypothetical protein